MKWVPDRSGRFPRRPHYHPEELESECEQIITAFLEEQYRRVEFPIRTDDLTILIERVVDDLDAYADLSNEDGEVEGLTEFPPRRKPRVRISVSLAAPYLENRLRTTLAHEFGHVHFHGFLFELEPRGQSLFPLDVESQINKCRREAIVGANRTDWMEWQAAYACGALLMPRGPLRAEVQAFAERGRLPGEVAIDTAEGAAMIERIAAYFQVSREAARVRLLQRAHLVGPAAGTQEKLSLPS